MLPAKSERARQPSDLDPILLWRDAPLGRREGLALIPQSCTKSACDCREMNLEVLAITDDLICIAANDGSVSVLSSRKAAGHGACLLPDWVDIDSGAATVDQHGMPAHSDAAALSWLRSELSSGPLLGCLTGV